MQDLDRAGDTGSVRLDGAWWRARRRDGLLAPGQTVRVVDLDGLQLIVEVASQPARPAPADAEPPVSRAQPHQADRSTAKEARS